MIIIIKVCTVLSNKIPKIDDLQFCLLINKKYQTFASVFSLCNKRSEVIYFYFRNLISYCEQRSKCLGQRSFVYCFHTQGNPRSYYSLYYNLAMELFVLESLLFLFQTDWKEDSLPPFPKKKKNRNGKKGERERVTPTVYYRSKSLT